MQNPVHVLSVKCLKRWEDLLGEGEVKRERKRKKRKAKKKKGDCERGNHKVILVCLDRLLVSRAWIALWRLEVNLVSAAVLN